MNFFRKGWQWANEQTIKFWWRSGSLSGYRTVFGICHCWEIWKVLNGHKSAAHTDSHKTCLCGGMHWVCTVPVLLVVIIDLL